MRFLALALTVMPGVLAPALAWSEPAGRAVSIDKAYVAIVPKGSTDVDFVLALQRGIELVLCESGVRPRSEGAESASELKLAASLIKAEYETDLQAREIVRECELTGAAATLPGGASVPLPDLTLSGRAGLRQSAGGRAASESFFVACGASFARTALDALKDRVTVRRSSCEEPPKSKPRRKR